MSPEEIEQLVIRLLSDSRISSLACPYHQHTTTDVGQLDAGKSLIGAPQTAITADSGGTAGATYTAVEQGIINNTHTRVNDIYLRLQNLNLLK